MSIVRNSVKVWVLIGALIASSCNSLVDIKPRFNIPTAEALATATDLEAAVNGAYGSMQATGGLGVAMRLVPELISDNVQINDQAYRNGQQLYFGAYQRNLFNTADNIWRDGYTAIERANNVISAIDNGFVKLIDNNYLRNRARLKAEALFIRGIMHFELVRLYGHQYGVRSDDPQSGVIIRNTPTADRVGLPRNTVTEVYRQVTSDLSQAIDSLPVDYDASIHPTSYGGRVGGRATQDAAKGYLAKVYFQMATPATNDSALNLINEVMGMTPGSPTKYWNPSQDIIRSRDDNFFYKQGNMAAAQTIFQIVNTFNPVTNELSSSSGSFLNAYLSASLDPTEPTNAPFPVYVASQEFVTRFGGSLGGTQRQQLYIPKNPGAQYYIFKFLRRSGQPAAINIPIIRGAEMLLTRAEIYAYKGQNDAALADLNAVRTSVGRQPAAINLSQDDLIRAIAFERQMELAFEGDRFFDFKRRNRIDATLFSPGAHDSEVLYSGVRGGRRDGIRLFPELRWDDNPSLLQIPDAEVFSNAQIKSNP